MGMDKSKISNMIDYMKNVNEGDLKNLDKEYYNVLILRERERKIQSVINEYGESQFYIAFSGGKDSCVLSELIDWAIPDNQIPRVFVDTGIELNIIRNFVYDLAEKDDRIIIIKPTKNVKQTLENYGYPFKSKVFSSYVYRFRRSGLTKSVKVFCGIGEKKWSPGFSCPQKLKYLFEDKNATSFSISMRCCVEMKEKPMIKWQRENENRIPIIGIMQDEGGGRNNSNCMNFKNEELKSFQPLVKVTKEWEDWFILNFDIKICDIYKEPYNFPRTGCKGCPFNFKLQHELDILEKYFPEERKQCELIWGPVYDEYRRIGYRLNK